MTDQKAEPKKVFLGAVAVPENLESMTPEEHDAFVKSVVEMLRAGIRAQDEAKSKEAK